MLKRLMRLLPLLALLATVLLAAACGSKAKPTTTPQATGTTTGTTTATAQPTAAGAPMCKSTNQTEGVTASEIKVGNTNPHSGPVSGYYPVAQGIDAYLKYINAQGGVNGRKINFISLDDAYSPPKTVELTKQLVEQDHVFVDLNPLGTPSNTAIRAYMNQHGVPQLFVATGATTWGRDFAQYPCTLGWQPDYESESEIYAQYLLKNMPDAKIAVLYQNDDYGQDYLNGLVKGLGDKASSMIVAKESYATSEPDISPHVAKLKGTGANVLFLFTTPAFTVQALKAKQQLGWNPIVFDNSVSSSLTIMKAAGDAASQGALSAVYIKDPSDPKYASDPTVQQYKQVLKQYLPQADPNNGLFFYGFALADQFVYVLKQMGSNVTRDNLWKVARNMDYVSPYMLPGIKVHTSDNPPDYFPLQQMQLEKYDSGKWVPFGEVYNTAQYAAK